MTGCRNTALHHNMPEISGAEAQRRLCMCYQILLDLAAKHKVSSSHQTDERELPMVDSEVLPVQNVEEL